MAKTSDIAKEILIRDIRNLHPDSAFIDKKLYVNLNIEGEEVQIAITLTAPKTKLNFGETKVTNISSAIPLTQSHYEETKKEVKEIFDFFKM